MRELSVALVHHPVLDAKGDVVTSTITTIDIHDIARSAKTYGCKRVYLVHPIEAQRTLAMRVVDHWTHGSSAKRIPDRKDALEIVECVCSLEEAVAGASREAAAPAETWATAARVLGTSTPWDEGRAALHRDGPPVVLVFGTSWGLAPSVIDGAAKLLDPIHGAGQWNHLSVRAACAIALDRLARA